METKTNTVEYSHATIQPPNREQIKKELAIYIAMQTLAAESKPEEWPI